MRRVEEEDKEKQEDEDEEEDEEAELDQIALLKSDEPSRQYHGARFGNRPFHPTCGITQVISSFARVHTYTCICTPT
jgi:hypothetical protein